MANSPDMMSDPLGFADDGVQVGNPHNRAGDSFRRPPPCDGDRLGFLPTDILTSFGALASPWPGSLDGGPASPHQSDLPSLPSLSDALGAPPRGTSSLANSFSFQSSPPSTRRLPHSSSSSLASNWPPGYHGGHVSLRQPNLHLTARHPAPAHEHHSRACPHTTLLHTAASRPSPFAQHPRPRSRSRPQPNPSGGDSKSRVRSPHASASEPTSDDYLATLLNGDFSSPSLPPLYSSPYATPSSRLQSTRQPPLPLAGGPMPARRTRRPGRGRLVDLTEESDDKDPFVSSSPDRDTVASMAPPPRRRSPHGVRASDSSSSRRTGRSLAANGPDRKRKRNSPSNGSGSLRAGLPLPPTASLSSPTSSKAFDTFDLTAATEVPAELLPKDNRVKLGKFQCVICMDNVSNLTVTHCGHLFCSECLHSSLHIDSIKKSCPVCRTKVDVRDKQHKSKNNRSYYHLELKLMTATRKGKMPATG